MQTSNISCKACLGVMNTFSFCLSIKLFISPSIWNDNFACRSFLPVDFSFQHFEHTVSVLSDLRSFCWKASWQTYGSIFMIITSNSLLGRLLISLLLSSFSEGLFCLLSWNITIHLLILHSPAYFFVLVRFVISPALGDMTLYRRRFLGPSSTLTSGHYSDILQGFPYVGCRNLSVVLGPTAAGALVGRTELHCSWL